MKSSLGNVEQLLDAGSLSFSSFLFVPFSSFLFFFFVFLVLSFSPPFLFTVVLEENRAGGKRDRDYRIQNTSQTSPCFCVCMAPMRILR